MYGNVNIDDKSDVCYKGSELVGRVGACCKKISPSLGGAVL